MFLNPWYSGQQQQQQQQKAIQKPIPDNSSSPSQKAASTSQSNEEPPGLASSSHVLLSSPASRRHSIQTRLGSAWTVHLSPEGRFYYCNHLTQTSGWLPPSDSWDSVSNGTINLPYGWEIAQDKEGRTYFINHLNKTTSYEDPRKWDLDSEPDPEPRSVELLRDSEMGFGFVAGSEKPVIVRFVTSGGPSVKKLLPGDQILQINGEDVKLAPRDHVIQLVRNCKDKVSLLVCQPPLDNSSTRKSAILSAAKKAKLKSNPSRVRFAESVDINGFSDDPPTSGSVVPLMPNVLKVFLENGQTKSFKYDASTTVQDVIESLQAKLGLKAINHFSLVVEHIKSLRRNKLTLLDPSERLAQIASRPGAHNLRCLFRVTFVPSEAKELLREDPVAFEYLYVQSCNDVVQERFAPELQVDIALRLAALQIHQHVLSTSGPGPTTATSSASSSSSTASSSVLHNGLLSSKMAIKSVEKECGLDRFIPTSLRDTMKRKELRKLLTHFLKLNSSQCSSSSNGLLQGNSPVKSSSSPATSQISFTAVTAKLHYLKIIGDLPSYGAKCFSTNISDSNVETVILISPKFGISQINSLRNSVPLNLCDIEQVTSVHISKEDEISRKVDIQLKDPDKENIVLSLEERDAKELILVLQGYYKLLSRRSLDLTLEDTLLEEERGLWSSEAEQDPPPPYCIKHSVVTGQGWNYPKGEPKYSLMDFGSHPPYHTPPDGFRPLVSSDSGSDGDASMTSNNTSGESNSTGVGGITGSGALMDRNSNNISRLEHFNNSLSTPSPTKHLNTYIQNNIMNNINNSNNNNSNNLNVVHHTNNYNRSGGGGGILKKPSRNLSPGLNNNNNSSSRNNSLHHINHINNIHHNHQINNTQARTPEKRTNETLERLTEMKELVADAEEYLTDTSEHSTRNNDSELSPTNYGKLKHSDSLILLAQNMSEASKHSIHSLNKSPNSPANEAVNTSLFLHKSPLKDVLLMNSHGTSNSESEASTPAPSPARFSAGQPPVPPPPPPPLPSTSGSTASRLKTSDSSFGLHSPDNLPLGLKEENGEDLLKKIQSGNKDKFSSGNLVLDPDLIDLTMIPPPMTPDEDGVYRVFPGTNNPVSTPPTPFADRQSLEAELKALERESPGVSTEGTRRKSSWEWKREAKLPSEDCDDPCRSSNYLQGTRDLDNFIANVTIPPPPSAISAKKDSEIASFIIPPPPSSPLKPRSGSAGEVAPKIASLQKRLATLASPERSSPSSYVVDEAPVTPKKPAPPPSVTTKKKQGLPRAGHVQSQAEFFSKHKMLEASGPQDSFTPFSSSLPPPPPPRAPLGSTLKNTAPPVLPSKPSQVRPSQQSTEEEEEEDTSPPPSLPPRSTSRSPPPLSPSKPKPPLPTRCPPISSSLPPLLPAKTGRKQRIPQPSPTTTSEIKKKETESSRAIVFQKASQVLREVVEHITESERLCERTRNIQEVVEEASYSRAKESLTNESRQFVTASKLFVKSATESEDQLLDCLSHCINMMDRIRNIAREVAASSPHPNATRDLIAKVRHVAEAYLATLEAASGAPQHIDPNMNVLMKRATSLAGVLTTLMRSLRVFN